MTVADGEDAREVEFLVLAGFHLSVRDVKALVWGLLHHGLLLHLDLSSIALGDAGVAEVSQLFDQRNRLRELILHDCGVGEAGALKLLRHVKAALPGLRTLDLSFNKLGPKVAAGLADMLVRVRVLVGGGRGEWVELGLWAGFVHACTVDVLWGWGL